MQSDPVAARQRCAFLDLAAATHLHGQAARLLTDTFTALGIDAWPDLESAGREVEECIAEPNLCIGACDGEALLGWVGLRPMYERTWELHPMVVDPSRQRHGVGRALVEEIERRARAAAVIGIVLGTDDEADRTSLSQKDRCDADLFGEIAAIRNLANHPYEFYRKCGYRIVGVIPDANGPRKPDIWMWKKL